jgi:hypothetical protein
MSGVILILATIVGASGFTGEYDITEVILYYQDTSTYKLTVSHDENSGYYYLDWVDQWDRESREIGFEFTGYLGAYDFQNCGLGVYKAKDDGLAGFRVYPVVMRLLQVTSEGCQPLERSQADLSGFWSVEITEGERRTNPARMHLLYRKDGDYWDGGEFDPDFDDVSSGWGLVTEDVLVMGFQNLDIGGMTLKMYSIKGDTLEGRWIEAYYDYDQCRTIIKSEGTERAVRKEDGQ